MCGQIGDERRLEIFHGNLAEERSRVAIAEAVALRFLARGGGGRSGCRRRGVGTNEDLPVAAVAVRGDCIGEDAAEIAVLVCKLVIRWNSVRSKRRHRAAPPVSAIIIIVSIFVAAIGQNLHALIEDYDAGTFGGAERVDKSCQRLELDAEGGDANERTDGIVSQRRVRFE